MSASILEVQDHPDNMKLINWVMEDEGYALTCVGSAEEALEVLDKEPFDLVLMDISLPGMDGKEATRRLRAKPEFTSLPILAVTAHAIKGDAEDILASGVSALVTKPIAEAASLVRVWAKAKGLPFAIEYDGCVPETIQTDPTRLRQILINLIGNAIKFTETGSVRLITRLINDQQKPRMQFDAVDTGIGMTDEQVANLFRPFSQADSSTTRRFGGTGLGLTISKRFAELLGGNVTVVNSRPGVGTHFRATVASELLAGVRMIENPMEATTVADEIVEQAVRINQTYLQGCSILLAEDGPDNQRLIAHILKKAGADVTVKENGKLACDAALAARDQGNPFKVILMDIQMPVMDGYQATRQLRRQGYTGSIIALTAHAMAGDREKGLQAGCDDYATKPLNRVKLIEIIRTFAASTPDRACPEASLHAWSRDWEAKGPFYFSAKLAEGWTLGYPEEWSIREFREAYQPSLLIRERLRRRFGRPGLGGQGRWWHPQWPGQVFLILCVHFQPFGAIN